MTFKYKDYSVFHEFDFNELKGCKFVQIEGMEEDSDVVYFTLLDGRQFKMYHEQDCCESVYITDICGDVSDLVDSEIVHFDERTNEGDSNSKDKPDEWSESFTWTFYDIQTRKGSVTLRWLGESNGYYSESVDFQWGEKVTG